MTAAPKAGQAPLVAPFWTWTAIIRSTSASSWGSFYHRDPTGRLWRLLGWWSSTRRQVDLGARHSDLFWRICIWGAPLYTDSHHSCSSRPPSEPHGSARIVSSPSPGLGFASPLQSVVPRLWSQDCAVCEKPPVKRPFHFGPLEWSCVSSLSELRIIFGYDKFLLLIYWNLKNQRI